MYVQFYTKKKPNLWNFPFVLGLFLKEKMHPFDGPAISEMPTYSPGKNQESACILVPKRNACKPSSSASENVPRPFRARSRAFPRFCSHRSRTASTPARVLDHLRLKGHAVSCATLRVLVPSHLGAKLGPSARRCARLKNMSKPLRFERAVQKSEEHEIAIYLHKRPKQRSLRSIPRDR